jgi:hypothetical protein
MMKSLHKKTVLGGVVGGLVMLVFALGILLLSGASLGAVSLAKNLLLSMISLLISPIAGGFLAGLIGKTQAHHAGLISGLIAGLVVFVAWLVIAGFSWQSLISGLVLVLVWVFLSRLGAGLHLMGKTGPRND